MSVLELFVIIIKTSQSFKFISLVSLWCHTRTYHENERRWLDKSSRIFVFLFCQNTSRSSLLNRIVSEQRTCFYVKGTPPPLVANVWIYIFYAENTHFQFLFTTKRSGAVSILSLWSWVIIIVIIRALKLCTYSKTLIKADKHYWHNRQYT